MTLLAWTLKLQTKWLVLPISALLALSVVMGILAVISPERFRKLATGGSRWIDTNKLIAKLDQPVNIDGLVLNHARPFGVAVLAASSFLVYLFYQRFCGTMLGM